MTRLPPFLCPLPPPLSFSPPFSFYLVKVNPADTSAYHLLLLILPQMVPPPRSRWGPWREGPCRSRQWRWFPRWVKELHRSDAVCVSTYMWCTASVMSKTLCVSRHRSYSSPSSSPLSDNGYFLLHRNVHLSPFLPNSLLSLPPFTSVGHGVAPGMPWTYRLEIKRASDLPVSLALTAFVCLFLLVYILGVRECTRLSYVWMSEFECGRWHCVNMLGISQEIVSVDTNQIILQKHLS